MTTSATDSETAPPFASNGKAFNAHTEMVGVFLIDPSLQLQREHLLLQRDLPARRFPNADRLRAGIATGKRFGDGSEMLMNLDGRRVRRHGEIERVLAVGEVGKDADRSAETLQPRQLEEQ
jgi:hypothetical protein